jgi:hypothetical protein
LDHKGATIVTKRLVLHGYKVKGKKPCALCLSVCERVASREGDYDQIILPAGQHLKTQETVDRIMAQILIDKGVPESKLVLWSDLCPRYIPPRTHDEEIAVVYAALQALMLSASVTVLTV